MKLCIAEKPSVARDIAAVVGADSRKNGYFEGGGFQVTWTYGHLCTLQEPADYSPAWKFWSIASLPIIPQPFRIKLIDVDSYKNQFSIIEKLIADADEVINCGDAGQEGELIQRWVMHKAKCKCPVKRLWISSLTEEAIKEGFNSLRPSSDFDTLYQAGLARAIGDWLLGMNATRIYTLRCSSSAASVLSIGRVQTPTLAIIVNRFKEIQNFSPSPFWELKTVYRNVTFNALKGKFDSEIDAQNTLNTIKNHPLSIKSISEKKGVEYSPKLFDLTSLQVECNKKFAFSADDTLKIIQSLYEKKFTTYPRVDTTYLSDDIYPKIPGILKGLNGYESLTQPVLNAKIPKSKKVFDNSKVTDHHAIIPTGQQKGILTETEKKVYNLVVLHFIANFYPEAKVLTTTVLADVNGVEFKAAGKQIQSPGWRVLFSNFNADNVTDYNPKDDAEPNKEQVLPHFVVGESGPHAPEVLQKYTTPPKYFTEATLLRAMETAGKFVDNEELRDALKENGIGRPSTRAAIIETLFKRNYIIKEKKNLIPTSRGIELVEMINYDLLKSAELTGQWERKLRDIEKGNYLADNFIGELKSMVVDLVNQVKLDNTLKMISIVNDTDAKTKAKSKSARNSQPAIKTQSAIKAQSDSNSQPTVNEMSLKRQESSNNQKQNSSGGYSPISDYTPNSATSNDIIDIQKSNDIQNTKNTINSSDARKEVSKNLAENDKLNKSNNHSVKEGDRCPLCGKGIIIRGRTQLGCNRYKEGCNFRAPFPAYNTTSKSNT